MITPNMMILMMIQIKIRMMVLLMMDTQGEQLNRVEANLDTINSEVIIIMMMTVIIMHDSVNDNAIDDDNHDDDDYLR